MNHCLAILVKKSRWSETSIIATWVTNEFGTLRTSVRGALRQGSPFAGKLDLFHRTEIGFTFSKSGTLHSLREVNLRQTFSNPCYAALVVASYFSELTSSVTPPMQPSHALHDLLSRALHHLQESTPSRRAFDHFEKETVRLLGIWDPAGRTSPHAALAQICGKLLKTRQTALSVLASE